jgi:formylglycine-generating enzyme required for sulfatase activity
MNQEKPTRIFISYRRDDTDAVAENIYHHLEKAFGKVVFKDNLRIGPGDLWKEKIECELESSVVVLALIGKDWFIHDKDNCIRLENEDDWVRKELEYSLQNGKKLVPILIDGAKRPTEKSFRHLPILKEKLPAIQTIQVNSRDLKTGLHKLIHGDLPGLGIHPLPSGTDGSAETDILADYPLPIKPEKEKLPPPYVGLRPFSATESFLFFGRDQDILQLIKKLESGSENRKIILFHGRSGVGKSSMLTAGLYLRMKGKGWEVPKPRRRQKEKGLAADLLELMHTTDDCLCRLFVLDQVEEIFSNPQTEPEKEIAAFQDALLQFLNACENARLLLSFRSDYFTLVRQILDDKNIPWDEMELFPLYRNAVLKAITGVAEKPELSSLYQLRFDPPALPQDIRDDVLRDKNSSHITPLLQYQLEKLFHRAAPGWEFNKQPIIISKDLYSEDFRKDNLGRLLDAEFEFIRQDWPHHHDSGLALDVLYQYITEQATAGSRDDADIIDLYEHIPDFPAFFDYLKNRRSLLTGLQREDGAAPAARLAHDSLAPLLLARFRNSIAPGQRAWQVLEPKLKDLGKSLKPTLLPADDLKIVDEGRCGMRALPKLEGLIAESTSAQRQRETEQLKTKAYIFDSFADVGTGLILSLDYTKALEKMKVAVEADMDFETKKKKLETPLHELLFFFAEGGRRPELARTSAKLLLKLQPGKTLEQGFQKCTKEGWNNRSQFASLLNDLPSYQVLKTRYYPEMIEVPPMENDNPWEMGSSESEPGHQGDEQLHKVKLSPFRMAATPVTFFQFALYCEANEKSISSRAPSWGLFGDHPLVNIMWYEAVEFCNWLSLHLPGMKQCYVLNKKKNSDKNNEVPNDYLRWKVDFDQKANGFRLPAEVEWEFAARGGRHLNKTIFADSDILDEVGWFWKNSGDEPLSGTWDQSRILDNNGRTHPVKQKKDNGIGLYDMSGNVYEWCWDWYAEDYYQQCEKKGIVTNPTGPKGSETGRVLRGGAWSDDVSYCRVACRLRIIPNYRYNSVGFRPAQGYTHPVHF